MKEKRTIRASKVRQSCIDHRWYTRGDIEEYDKMLSYVRGVDIATTDEIETIATDIKEHSDTEYDILNIMFVLVNECCTTYFID